MPAKRGAVGTNGVYRIPREMESKSATSNQSSLSMSTGDRNCKASNLVAPCSNGGMR